MLLLFSIYACLDVVIRMAEWLYISFAKIRISEEIAKVFPVFLKIPNHGVSTGTDNKGLLGMEN
jgi:hypothetical protein